VHVTHGYGKGQGKQKGGPPAGAAGGGCSNCGSHDHYWRKCTSATWKKELVDQWNAEQARTQTKGAGGGKKGAGKKGAGNEKGKKGGDKGAAGGKKGTWTFVQH